MGRYKLNYFPSLEDAKEDFEKKFRDKTKNSWAEREHFVAHPSKYTLIKVQGEDEVKEAVVKVKFLGVGIGGPWAEGEDTRPSALGSATVHCASSGQTCPLTSAWPCCKCSPSAPRWTKAP